MLEQSQIIDAICAATQDVFGTMLGMEAQPGEPYTDHSSTNPIDGVVSLLGLAGAWIGSGSVSMSASLACKISSQFLMAEYPAVNEEVLDAVAEVTNMIVGNFKTTIEDILGPMGMSIPTVIFGRNFTTRSIASDEWTSVPFNIEGETMIVRICLTPARNPVAVRHGFVQPTQVGPK
jgi:chemotaxis protein CheX